MAKKIALGVSSSVSIYKACQILRGFQKNNHEIQVIMTKNATRLASPLLFSSLSGLRTIVDMYEEPDARTIRHVSLAEEISLLCVAPATANVIAKFAAGLADDFLSTFFLSARCPVLIAPAMNQAMYLHPQTQANIKLLKERGVFFIEPESGYLACKKEGLGRLAEPDRIVEAGLALISPDKSLAGKKVIVTAGPTREYLDPVRFLSNPSSGKMGYELAREARHRGGEVTLISGPTSLRTPYGVSLVKVESASEMNEALQARANEADIIIMAAAVLDFRFKTDFNKKIKKDRLPSALEIEKTPDIIASVSQGKLKHQVVVGFAAETEAVLENARQKMTAKNLDLIVANEVGKTTGFGSDDNEVLIVSPSGGVRHVPKASKREISRTILDVIGELLEQKQKDS